jgi:hypothetical protein
VFPIHELTRQDTFRTKRSCRCCRNSKPQGLQVRVAVERTARSNYFLLMPEKVNIIKNTMAPSVSLPIDSKAQGARLRWWPSPDTFHPAQTALQATHPRSVTQKEEAFLSCVHGQQGTERKPPSHEQLATACQGGVGGLIHSERVGAYIRYCLSRCALGACSPTELTRSRWIVLLAGCISLSRVRSLVRGGPLFPHATLVQHTTVQRTSARCRAVRVLCGCFRGAYMRARAHPHAPGE